MSSSEGADVAAAARSRRWRAGLVLTGSALVSFQGGVLRIAFPVIRDDLGAGVPAMQAVSMAGLVATTATVVAFGRLADLVGARRVYAGGLGVFAAGAGLSAAVPGPGWLVAAQMFQGLGWAMVLSSGTPLLVTGFHPDQRGRAVAASHMAIALGLAGGPAVGGVLVDRYGWRAALLVLAPAALVLAVLVLARTSADAPSAGPGRSFDLTGSALLAAALGCALVGVEGRGRLGPAGIGALLAAAGAGLVAFVAHERRARDPMLDLDLFRRRSFTAGLAAAFLTFAAMASNMFLLPFFLQEGLGYDVASAGLFMVVVPVGILALAPAAGWLADRSGPRLPATAGAALVTLAIALLAGLGASPSAPRLVAVLAVYGAGAGLFQSPNISGVLGVAPPERLGVASGALSTVGRLGQVVGVAVAGALWDRAGARPDAATGFRSAFLALAACGALAAAASWLRGPVPAAGPGSEPDPLVRAPH